MSLRFKEPWEVLAEAAARLKTPGVWCQFTAAVDQDGNALRGEGHNPGVKWSAWGAMVHAAAGEENVRELLANAAMQLFRSLGRPLRQGTFSESVQRWNDEPGQTQETVVAALKRASERARMGQIPKMGLVKPVAA